MTAWLLDSACAGGVQSGPAGTRRRELVIVASLIDKVPNLAGLARTAEVLGVGTLVLSDLRVANDQLFTRLGGS
jgi:tRNA G18 (ribose-2'-O)-methylase SpoU